MRGATGACVAAACAAWLLGMAAGGACGAAMVDIDATDDAGDDAHTLTDDTSAPDESCGTVWYYDGDGDTVGGDSRPSVCAPSQPSGSYVPLAGDCCDTNGNVHPPNPAPLSYHSSSYNCGAGPSFDWDCNGMVEQEFPDTDPAPDCTAGVPCGFNHAGWEGGHAPECGSPGRWVQGCISVTCVEDVITRTQACR